MEGEKHLCSPIEPPKKKTYEYSQNVTQVLGMTSGWTEEEKLGLCCALVKRMSVASLTGLKNYVIPRVKELKASEQQSIVVSSAPSASTSKEVTETASKEAPPMQLMTTPHYEVPLIVRADLVQEGAPLALDTEKLVVHVSKTTTRNVGGDFALVDLQGRLVLWCYIRRENVCVYNTEQTGLTEAKVKNGISEQMFHDILSMILKKSILVGAAVDQDLKDLGLSIGNLPGGSSRYDIQDFFKDQDGDKVSLAILGEHFTGHSFQSGVHSSLSDARMTALAYKRMLRFKEIGYTNFSCPDFDSFRVEMKQKKKNAAYKKRWEKCRCFAKKPKYTPIKEWNDARKLPGI